MGLFLPIIVTLIWLYVLWRVLIRLPLPATGKTVVAILLLLTANYHQIVGRFFGSFTSPELPRSVMIALAWAFGVFLLLALLALVRDVFILVLKFIKPKLSRNLLVLPQVNVLLLLAAILLSIYGVWQAVKVPNVKTIGLVLKGLPSQFDGYRLVQLSDLHASRLLPYSWQSAVAKRTNQLQPDLIVITGDLADGSVQQRARDIQPFAELKAKDGVVAIPGNHEYYTDYLSWIKALRDLNLTVLENQHVLIKRGNDSLVIAGLTDRQARSFAQPEPNLDQALAGKPDNMPVILLQHRPDTAVANAAAGVTLQLSGHTHGGQILGPNLLTKYANNGFLSGLYQLDNMRLYISNGTGLWHGLAVRLGVSSEITEIILKAK